VVGGAGTIYTTKGFEMLSGRYRAVNFPGAYVYGFAAGINNAGTVIGTADACSYIYKNGQFKNIDVPGANRTAALGINDSGIVAGWYFSTSCNCSFVYKNGKFLSFSYPGAVFTAAAGINASGQIVGEYTFDYQTYHGFLTSPITQADFR